MSMNGQLRSAARRAHRDLLFPALDFILPSACFVCGSPLGRWQHLGACASCWSGLEPLRSPLCVGCGLPAPSGTDLHGPARGLCGRCLVSSSLLDGVRAAVVYDGVARSFLLRAKLGRRRELMLPLARRLAAAVRAAGLQQGCDLAVPVPSHPLTDLWRGFSPSRELARHLSRLLRIPLSCRVLRRRFGPGGVTKRLPASGRPASARREFRLRASARARGVLLVDDVMTTGASAEACAELLKQAGARLVRLAVWARKPIE
jgi:predicted amidophosphoribosyltransferase